MRCLDHLAGFAQESDWLEASLDFAQKSTLRMVSEAHFNRPPPPAQETPQAALRQKDDLWLHDRGHSRPSCGLSEGTALPSS